MMLGTRDEFNYFQCSSCECLQIANIPGDMSPYYPDTYYSFVELENTPANTIKKVRNALMKKRDMYAITNEGILGQALYALRPFTELRALSSQKITKSSSILDIGCGTGHYLYKLNGYGFTNLLGADPYLKETITYKNGLTIKKADISEITGTYDVVMLHHSLEHMENQRETMQTIASLLNDTGFCLIRIPTVSSVPWELYRENWVHLDPPRHFFLHSHKSLTMIAEEAGLAVVSITSDATPFSFYGSEFYKRGIPASEWTEETFSEAERKDFAKRAREINKSNHGDTIAVILKKK
jgi:2-polyprenyl-3-methyl-5-hydroxy-6-metoxy-1,4-benzoquinol methylase